MSRTRDTLLPALLAAAALHAAAVGWLASRPEPPPPRAPRAPTQVRLVARTPAPAPRPPPAPEPPRRASVVPRGTAPRPPREIARAAPPAPAERPTPPPPPRRFAVSMDAVVPGGGAGVAVPVAPGPTAPRGDPRLPASAPVGDNAGASRAPADVTEVERAPVLVGQPSAAETRALYPDAARREGVEADVGLELLVTESGDVAEVRVVRRAGQGFDEVAEKLGKRMRFRPAERAGRAVAVRIPWTWKFRLDR